VLPEFAEVQEWAIMDTMYEIEFTPEALEDLQSLRKFEQQEVIAGVESQLKHEPTVETRNRKKLRPNDFAAWELRIGRFRVFYNVDDTVHIVSLEAIGFKIGNQLFIRGEKRKL
jgi:mRNA-degrading endonuclease RelE of RelBE toxin-antitoxin system